MLKICIVNIHSYPLFQPETLSSFGGAEVRSWLFADGLSKLPDNDISFVVFDHGQPDVERFGRVVVHRHPCYPSPEKQAQSWLQLSKHLIRSSRFPYFAFRRVTPRMVVEIPAAFAYQVWTRGVDWLSCRLGQCDRLGTYRVASRKTHLYGRIDADIYCAFGATWLSAEVAAFCEEAGKKFVLFGSSDVDFSEDYRPDSRKMNAYRSRVDLCYYSIARADLVVTQTTTQSELLRERFGKPSVTVRSCIDLESTPETDPDERTEEKVALWIGKSDGVKRPEVLIQLAQRFPNIQFQMNRAERDRFERIQQAKPANVNILEGVPFHKIETLFKRAFVFINTSVFEGFPNTFLQAGKYGVPVLSFAVDPDGMFERHACGVCAGGDFERLAEGLASLHSDSDRRARLGDNIREYVRANHDLNAGMLELSQVLGRLMESDDRGESQKRSP